MKGFCLEATGDYACFTRPELKVERVSYDVPTPSAVRGIYEAIFWKPEIRWNVRTIEVLHPIRWISVRKNELKSKQSPSSSGCFIEEDRTQRAGLFLRDVKYRFFADFELSHPDNKPETETNPAPHPKRTLFDLLEETEDEISLNDLSATRRKETEAKYAAMFERRAKKGQCFTRPYFGCREFPVEFRLIPDPMNEPVTPPESLLGKRDLGWMLYDLDFKTMRPRFFRAIMNDGKIVVPYYNNTDEVKE